jgi:hypothetical protein
MMHKAGMLLSVFVAALAAAPGRADFMYAFDQSSYTVATGQTVDVRVFLQETTSALLSTDGLIAGGTRVNFSGGSAAVLSSADILYNPAFDDPGGPITSLSSGSAGLTELVDITTPGIKAVGGPPFEVLLGTFQFTAGTSPGVTTLTVTNFGGGIWNFTDFPSSEGLDPLIADGSATITVTSQAVATPEPSSLILVSSGAVALVLGYWRQRAGRKSASHS